MIFSYIDYYRNSRFSTSVFSARDTLKMTTQTKLQKPFDKRNLSARKQVQTKISSFLKSTKKKQNNNEVIYVGEKCLSFRVWKINLQHKFSINNHQWKFSYILLLYFPLGTSVPSSPATKKCVGRPAKLYTSDQVRDMIAKHHDFQEMVNFSKKYDQLFEIYSKPSVCNR